MIADLTVTTAPNIVQEIGNRLDSSGVRQNTHDHIATYWVPKDRVRVLLRYLKEEVERPYKMLYDLSAIDERMRVHREGQPASDFTVVYHLSFL
jgi:NADH-quinone oxidoreductase subunit C/D